MNAKEQAIKKYDYEIANLQMMRQVLESLPDLDKFEGGIFLTSSQNLRFDVPYTPDAFTKFRQLLGKEWKRKGHEWTSEDGDKYFSFCHKETQVRLLLCLRPDLEGATCQRKQIGTKEIPVYEVICS